jgi:hypothetical protein
MAAFVGEGIPNFEIRNAQKGPNTLVERRNLNMHRQKPLRYFQRDPAGPSLRPTPG